jgi:hypothetical protein
MGFFNEIEKIEIFGILGHPWMDGFSPFGDNSRMTLSQRLDAIEEPLAVKIKSYVEEIGKFDTLIATAALESNLKRVEEIEFYPGQQTPSLKSEQYKWVLKLNTALNWPLSPSSPYYGGDASGGNGFSRIGVV